MTYDILIAEHGTIALISGETSLGQRWLDKHIDPGAQRFGKAVVAEPRYVDGILEQMVMDDLIVGIS